MKAIKAILYTVTILAIVASVALIIYDSTILNYFGISNSPDFWKAWLAGIVSLLALDMLIDAAHAASLSKQIRRKEQEINDVKVKFFDEVTNRDKEKVVIRETTDRAAVRRDSNPEIKVVPKSDNSPLR